jgi:hypothetical protein
LGIVTLILAALIVIAAFVPWGEIRGTPSFSGGFAPMFGEVRLTMTGWNGNLTVAGVQLPNWLTVVAAVAVVFGVWLTVLGILPIPLAALIVVAAYGLLHTAFLLILLATSNDGSPGLGAALTAVLFAIMLAVLIRNKDALKAPA